MKRWNQWGRKMLVTLGAAVALAGCASGGYYARAPLPPPPPGAFVRVPAPGAGYVWRDGYYDWYGGRYRWVSSGWVRPPRSGVVWVNPGWNGRRWRGGRWR
jgi:hypothetical protein